MNHSSEVVSDAVRHVKRNLIREPVDYHSAVNEVHSGQFPNYSSLLEPGRQPLIAAKVGPFEVTLVHPNRANASDIFVNSQKGIPGLRFQEGGREIRPIDLCVGISNRKTVIELGYVVSKGKFYAVSPPERQTIERDPQESSTNVIYVNKAYHDESLALARLAQKTVRSYRQRQRDLRKRDKGDTKFDLEYSEETLRKFEADSKGVSSTH